ncbi:siderophore biosynthesis [Fusarium subglutinans]|uniref:Siderophore biosynthesis n=1 Tax=Gibberella subglutinans TaxID=42677 RepID=A0A8H5QA70_GIBSU|nr:siderophore biosynthesis [Fusarium subglutinans]KAF5611499.1 siderophore biosynthesis [Fusarium subglutinans]
MVKSALLTAIPLLMLAEQALGFGCSTHSYTTCQDKIVHWFDPDDGMICDPLDCGGGRAPPKTGVPGCAGYTGTETIGTSYLSCWKPSTTLVAAAAETTSETTVTKTAEPSTVIEVETRTTTRHVVSESAEPLESIRVTAATGSTTVAPVLPSATKSTDEAVSASTPAPAATTAAANAARVMEASLIAVAGVALGAIVLL